MRKLLFVIDSLDYSGRARQLTQLAAALPRDRFAVRVCALGPDAPWGDDLRAAGVRVDHLGQHRTLDLKPLWSLHRLVAEERPDVIHAWGLKAASALVLSGYGPARLTLSAALPTRAEWHWPVRLLLRCARRVIALGESEAEGYRRLGVAADRLAVVSPGVAVPTSRPAPAARPGLPDDARVMLCLGPILRHKGHRDAAWSIDILRLIHDRVHLVIVGDGPGIDFVDRLVKANNMAGRVHRLGAVREVSPWLARAEVVWVPSLRQAGRYAALESMAAGRPVVASRLPGLAEVVADGATGYLIPPGDKSELCKRTRLLLAHPDVAADMGAAGRRRVAERFSLEAHVGAMVPLFLD